MLLRGKDYKSQHVGVWPTRQNVHLRVPSKGFSGLNLRVIGHIISLNPEK
jgi:hypothetical protein